MNFSPSVRTHQYEGWAGTCLWHNIANWVIRNCYNGCLTTRAVLSSHIACTCLWSWDSQCLISYFSQPIEDISKAIREKNKIRSSEKLPRILIHTDAAQAIGKIKVNVKELGVDYLTVVGHKFYGPRIGEICLGDSCWSQLIQFCFNHFLWRSNNY